MTRSITFVVILGLALILATQGDHFAIAQETESAANGGNGDGASNLNPEVNQDNEEAVEDVITIDEPLNEPSIQVLKPDWRNNFGVLTIGYLIEGNRQRQRRRLEPFRLALQRKSRLQVSMRPVRTLDELIKLQIDRRIQYAFHSASSYVQTQIACKCVEPLVVPSDEAGSSGIQAVLLAPFNGNVRRLTDLKGNRLAIPRPPAVVTRLLPLKALHTAGYTEPDDHGVLVDVDNPVEGWQKVLNGEADATIGWSSLAGYRETGYSRGTLNHLIQNTKLARSTDIRIIWQSAIVPNAPHVIRSDIPTELKALLRDFLSELKKANRAAYDSASPLLSGGFVLVNDEAFSPLHALAESTAE